MRVLVVDDNPGDAELVVELLSRGTERVTCVFEDSLATGLRRNDEERPDVVLLDLHLGDSKGLATVEAFRAHAPLAPIIVLTGMNDLETSLEAIRRGADDYVVKGEVTRDILVRAIRHAIERRAILLRLEAERRVVEVLARTGASLASELDPAMLAQRVVDAATAVTGAEICALFENRETATGDAYGVLAFSGISPDVVERMPMPRNTPLFASVFFGKAPVRLDDVIADARYGQLPPHRGIPAGHPVVRSFLAVPITSRSGAVGLFLGHSAPARFTPEHERLSVGIASWAALASDNARLFRDVQRAVEAREDILRVVSHDLRNQLSTVTSGLALLKMDGANEERRNKRVGQIERAIDTVCRLISDLLDASAMEKGTLSIQTSVQRCDSIVDEAYGLFADVCAEKGIRIERACEGGDAVVLADRERLVQVLGNLLGNAMKFTPVGGLVTIGCGVREGRAAFFVKDTGPGIPEEELVRVFDRFYRRAGTPGKGLGLGLTIARGLVEAHRGKIWVESRAGAGTKVVFELPIPETSMKARTA